MIPFEEIDKRLDALGKNRAWLAQITGRSPDSLRTSLAPNAPSAKRTDLLQRALSEAIEREEADKQVRPLLPDRITLEAPMNEIKAWGKAAGTQGLATHDWAVNELNKSAKLWAETPLTIHPKEDASNKAS